MGEPNVINFGGVISEKVRESIEDMDVMTVLQKMVATTPEDEESETIREKLQGVLQQFNEMSDEDKVTFTKQIKDGLANKIAMKMREPGAIKLDGLEDAIKEAVVFQLFLVGVVVAILVLLFVFFGYKLYKSIKDKELKKEEKKKAKQMKKKK
ncbi:uncharacterized protein LOC135084947 isoform X1 [Ostrinia nubilalis]|nr:uncharacterized protein LOC114364501 isoform X2 [Ostrinia furnacalis]XP_028176499.1 uncharacterized protein LOC114364501 isoform X2 [Ostrinia furnacalis]